MQGLATRLQGEEYEGKALLEDKGWHSSTIACWNFIQPPNQKEQRWLN
jgi:hypothetical protein